MNGELRVPALLCISFLLPHKMAAQFCGGPDLSPHKMAAQFCGVPDLFTPRTHLVRPWGPRSPALIYGERIALYLVPLARSRYCASPEASIPPQPPQPSQPSQLSQPSQPCHPPLNPWHSPNSQCLPFHKKSLDLI